MKPKSVVLCWVAVIATCSMNLSQPHLLDGSLECTYELRRFEYDIRCINITDWKLLLQVIKDKIRDQNINRMWLINSHITYLGESDLEDIKVREFNLDTCVIEEIDDKAFLRAFKLKTLHWIRMADMTTIPRSVAETNVVIFRHMNGALTSVEKQLQNMTLLQEVDLSYNKISHIDPDAFQNCRQLKTVDISYNQIRQLDRNLFRNSHSLTTVFMTHNELSSTEGVLSPSATSIKTLFLDANNFTSFSDAAHFVSPVNIIELAVADNNFNVLKPGQFNGKFKKLILLILRNNSLQQIERGAFDTLVDLKLINLSHNNLTELPEDLFARNPMLREVRLDHNNIRTISRLFLNNTSLGRLHLSSNKIKDIDGAFNTLSNLYWIFLDNNLIESIPRGTFASTTILARIHLHNNKIQTLTNESFLGLNQALQVLDLTNNNLEDLGDAFSNEKLLPNLTYLHLGRNNLSSLSHLDLKLKNLTYLDLANNSVFRLDKAFVIMQDLQILNLAGNMLSTIREDNFYDFKTLRRLHIQGNPLTCDCRLLWITYWHNATNVLESSLCAAPYRLTSKQVHELTSPELNDWPDDCPEECKCTCFPAESGVIVNASCDGRNLRSVPKTLPTLTNFLNLSFNNLKIIPEDIIETVPNLKILDLRGNYLETLDNVWLSPELKELDISLNSLTRFPSQLLNYMKLTTGKFSGNPWICDCDAEPFRTWLLKNYRVIPDINQTYCSNDSVNAEIRGKRITSLLEKELCPLGISALYFIAIGVLVFLLGVASVFIGYIRYQMPIKVWLYSKGLCLRCVKEEDIDEDKDFDAFVAFHVQEQNCVNKLLQELENKEPHYRLCVHYRNFLGGELIMENISRAVGRSKRIIVLLSSSFLGSQWTMCEFREALRLFMMEKVNRILLVLVGQLPPDDELPEEIRVFVKTVTYLKWEDKYFWQKLLYAMPKTPITKEDVTWKETIM